MTKIKLPFKMNKQGTNYLTYPNLRVVREEIESVLKENREDFNDETINNFFEIMTLCREADHKIKLIDKLVSDDTTEDSLNSKWEDY
jgi:hypothetical protein